VTGCVVPGPIKQLQQHMHSVPHRDIQPVALYRVDYRTRERVVFKGLSALTFGESKDGSNSHGGRTIGRLSI
jgi:hypothetical protein